MVGWHYGACRQNILCLTRAPSTLRWETVTHNVRHGEPCCSSCRGGRHLRRYRRFGVLVTSVYANFSCQCQAGNCATGFVVLLLAISQVLGAELKCSASRRESAQPITSKYSQTEVYMDTPVDLETPFNLSMQRICNGAPRRIGTGLMAGMGLTHMPQPRSHLSACVRIKKLE